MYIYIYMYMQKSSTEQNHKNKNGYLDEKGGHRVKDKHESKPSLNVPCYVGVHTAEWQFFPSLSACLLESDSTVPPIKKESLHLYPLNLDLTI